MIIQPILFKPKNLIDEPELFFRGVTNENILEDKVIIPAGASLSLETYFNAFSIGKWREYTNLDNLSLHLKIKGDVEIEAYHTVGSVNTSVYNKNYTKLPEKELIQLVNSKSYKAVREKAGVSLSKDVDDYTVTFRDLFNDGILYITIMAKEEAVLLGGYYASEVVEPLNPVKLAIGICTFKKKEFVTSNINRILMNVLNNPASPLKDNLEVFVADNGQTLDVNCFKSDKVHVLPNPNLGGSGGFTRTMIEAMIYEEVKAFTHIIFMDDDILLYPPIFERTFYLLQLLKQEYNKAILGGGMLYIETRYLHHACGAVYSDNSVEVARANHKFYDMRNPDAVAANEVVNKTNHTGWMYACIPRTIINENNLPMPFFVHFDDIEYGLRNLKNKEIYINGIAVWHPSPASKNPFWMIYYNTRNRLITMFSKPLAKKDFNGYIKKITIKFYRNVIQYNYTNAGLMLNAMKAFLAGPEAFMQLDAIALHADLIKWYYTYITPEEAGVSLDKIREKQPFTERKKMMFIQTLCLMIPAFKKVQVIDTRYFALPYFAKKAYLYNKRLGKGVLHTRSLRKHFMLLFSFFKVRKELRRRYGELLQEWQTAKPAMTNLLFWEKYLGLK